MTFFRKIWNADETNGNTTDVVQNVEDTNLDNEYGLVGSSILYGRIDTEKVKPLRIDGSTHSIQVIDNAHHEIHEGVRFFHQESYSLVKSGTVDHLIVTPDTTKWAHMVIGINNTLASIEVILYEDTVASANGTADTVFNRNRNSATVNTTLLFTAPTITTVGVKLTENVLGTGKNNPGGEVRDSEEIMLKQNTKYLLRISEPGIANTQVNLTFDWYEHTSKDI